MDFNFTERLIYHQLRMAIRATVSLSGVPLSRIQEILKYAAYKELDELDMKPIDISSHLKVAPSYVTKLSRLPTPSGSEEEAPLHLIVLDVLSRAQGYALGEAELRSRVLEGDFDPEGELGGPEVSDRDERDLDRALRYMERQGMLEVRPSFVYALTPKGIRLVERDLSRPYQRSTERLVALLALAEYLQASGVPKSEAELNLAAAEGGLDLSERAVASTLAWCRRQRDAGLEPYLVMAEEGAETTYAHPPDAWLTPNEGAEDKQLTLIKLVDELKAFIDWVSLDPDTREVAVLSLTFRVLPEDLFALLTRHREQTMAALLEAETRVQGDPRATQYVLNWFGRVLKRG